MKKSTKRSTETLKRNPNTSVMESWAAREGNCPPDGGKRSKLRGKQRVYVELSTSKLNEVPMLTIK